MTAVRTAVRRKKPKGLPLRKLVRPSRELWFQEKDLEPVCAKFLVLTGTCTFVQLYLPSGPVCFSILERLQSRHQRAAAAVKNPVMMRRTKRKSLSRRELSPKPRQSKLLLRRPRALILTLT